MVQEDVLSLLSNKVSPFHPLLPPFMNINVSLKYWWVRLQ